MGPLSLGLRQPTQQDGSNNLHSRDAQQEVQQQPTQQHTHNGFQSLQGSRKHHYLQAQERAGVQEVGRDKCRKVEGQGGEARYNWGFDEAEGDMVWEGEEED